MMLSRVRPRSQDAPTDRSLEVAVQSAVDKNEKPCFHRAFPGCAGPQLDFPAQQFQGLAEVWVPFEEAIVIGWR